jgi:hypothetical protein
MKTNPEDCLNNPDFKQIIVELLENSLTDNNISLYLTAVDTCDIFFKQCLLYNYNLLIDNLGSLARSIMMK